MLGQKRWMQFQAQLEVGVMTQFYAEQSFCIACEIQNSNVPLSSIRVKHMSPFCEKMALIIVAELVKKAWVLNCPMKIVIQEVNIVCSVSKTSSEHFRIIVVNTGCGQLRRNVQENR